MEDKSGNEQQGSKEFGRITASVQEKGSEKGTP
jgi:hypothetical protein